MLTESDFEKLGFESADCVYAASPIDAATDVPA